jgi:acetoacetate decarboxylase
MLQGFSVPLTPQGESALAKLPPWHYSSDCIAVEYWTDPRAVAALLPPGVVPDEKSNGRAFFWFLDWQFTGSHDELTDPARYQYREAFVLVEATFEGKPVNYCPYIFVDNDAAIARGWAQGFPRGARRPNRPWHPGGPGQSGDGNGRGHARRGGKIDVGIGATSDRDAQSVELRDLLGVIRAGGM